MRAHAWAEYFANGGRSRGGAAAREGGGTDGWGYPVSVPQREGRGRPDERDPLVSDRVRGRARAQRPRGLGGSGPACGPISRPLAAQCFSFCSVFALCLNLCIKLCADSKIMKIFVLVP